jgi:hypothetical protein
LESLEIADSLRRTMTHPGGCLCGAVRFTADGVEPHFHACHCGMCRRWSGGSPFFGAKAGSVRFDDEAHLGRYASSSWAERGFCTTCGTTLYYLLKPTHEHHLSVGAFDDPSPFRLTLELFIDRKPDGYALAGDHPRWTEAETFANLTPP